MPKTDKAFNVLLSSDHVAMLAQLATTLQCSKGLVIRDAIRYRFAMTCNKAPTCSTGMPCLVPALHGAPTVIPVPLQPPVTLPQPQLPPTQET